MDMLEVLDSIQIKFLMFWDSMKKMQKNIFLFNLFLFLTAEDFLLLPPMIVQSSFTMLIILWRKEKTWDRMKWWNKKMNLFHMKLKKLGKCGNRKKKKMQKIVKILKMIQIHQTQKKKRESQRRKRKKTRMWTWKLMRRKWEKKRVKCFLKDYDLLISCKIFIYDKFSHIIKLRWWSSCKPLS